MPTAHVNQNHSQPHDFILASSSPRRRELLAHVGLPFRVVLPQDSAGVDETPRLGETPAELVQRLSRVKARAVAVNLPLPPRNDEPASIPVIIAADTVVVLAGQILGKPAIPAEAVKMLKALRAQPYHEVFSGVTVGIPASELRQPSGGEPEAAAFDGVFVSATARWKLITRLHRSQVWMRAYTDAEIKAYATTRSPSSSACPRITCSKTKRRTAATPWSSTVP